MAHDCPPIESVIADIEKYDLSVMLINEDKDIVEHDPSVNDIADLAPGWRAWRENGNAEWHREAEISEEPL